MGSAFNPNLDYYTRIPAQRLFYQFVNKVQQSAIKLAGEGKRIPKKKKIIKPQISPFYTDYPASIAAYAAIGLTAFLEFKERCPDLLLNTDLNRYLDNPDTYELFFPDVDIESFRHLAGLVKNSVQTRILLEDLSRHPSLFSVEIYRLFSASQQNMKFKSVNEVINTVILYGDILPDWKDHELDPMTHSLLSAVLNTSLPFFSKLAGTENRHLYDLGIDWIRKICSALAPYLPLRDEDKPDSPAGYSGGIPGRRGDKKKFRYSNKSQNETINDHIPPLNKPGPPSLFREPSLTEKIKNSFFNRSEKKGRGGKEKAREKSPQQRFVEKKVEELSKALQSAGKNRNDWEDLPYDSVQKMIRSSAFLPGPIQGNPADGHEVKVVLGGKQAKSGEIFDRPVELSVDQEAFQKLFNESKDIIQQMRRTLYPNVETIPVIEHLHTSGALDPSRLPVAEFSTALFKRYRNYQEADKKGRPLLVIAADGSGSLNRDQMKMLKILVFSWLNSTVRTGIQVLAGLYHSGFIREGMTSPLVQWIYHPRKTPSISRADASRAVVSLQDRGTGVQSDALSIKFIMEEAKKLANGKMIYLILITDCAWNRSFNSTVNGFVEVQSVFKSLKEDLGSKLHTTLVSLGAYKECKSEDLAEKTIKLTRKELLDSQKVAEKIGLYVASCISERAKNLGKRRER
jgi:hypothetical protein